MSLKSLFLKDFRSYEEAYFEFSPGINYIHGPNAIGKTNLLEAIFLISTGKSFRTSVLKELIRSGATSFALAAQLEKQGVKQTLELRFDGTEKHLRIDATAYKSFSPLLGILPHVILTPEAVQFIQGSPLERRRFLDFHLAQSDPLYVHHYLRFAKAMKNRNELLRRNELTTIESWEEILTSSASYLILQRKKAIEELAPKLKDIKLQYKPSLSFQNLEEIPKKIKYRLEKLRPKELLLGYTLTGPHRDDLSLTIDGKEAREFASEGQKRICLANLRLAEWERLMERTGVSPLFSIDDFAVHLDSYRQSHLEERLKDLGQVFLTSPHQPSKSLTSNVFTVNVEDKHDLKESL
jgi:DNA replication and repair protein RecF